jgi:hypothetical protein
MHTMWHAIGGSLVNKSGYAHQDSGTQRGDCTYMDLSYLMGKTASQSYPGPISAELMIKVPPVFFGSSWMTFQSSWEVFQQ